MSSSLPPLSSRRADEDGKSESLKRIMIITCTSVAYPPGNYHGNAALRKRSTDDVHRRHSPGNVGTEEYRKFAIVFSRLPLASARQDIGKYTDVKCFTTCKTVLQTLPTKEEVPAATRHLTTGKGTCSWGCFKEEQML